MRQELTKEFEDNIPGATQEAAEQPKEELLTPAEVLDVAEGNLLRALNAIRMLR